jgi:hypothetical protein
MRKAPQAFQRHGIGKSIHEGTIHRGDAALGAIVTLAAMAALAALTADAAAREARPAPTTEATAPREAGDCSALGATA